MNALPCVLSQSDRERLASLPLRLSRNGRHPEPAVRRRIVADLCALIVGSGSTDDDVLRMYQALRQKAGLHPADLATIMEEISHV